MKNEQTLTIIGKMKCQKELDFIYPGYQGYKEKRWKRTSIVSSESLHLRKLAMSTVNTVDERNQFTEQKVRELSPADAAIVIACADELAQIVAKYKKKYLESVGRNDIVKAFGTDKPSEETQKSTEIEKEEIKMDRFKVKIPGGYLMVEAKGVEEEYPGVYISFSEDGKEYDVNKIIACVEYDSCSEEIKTDTYRPEYEEPTHIIRYSDGQDLM